jgi:SAM-dependent methyltransferase
MPHPSWNDSYTSGEPPPWDTGTPDPMLVAMIESHAIEPGRTLEVGCGTGTNAIYLAEHGFDVVGVDVAPVAIEKARSRAHPRCRFEIVDFLNEGAPGGPFQFVADRGCFHTFDNDRQHRGAAARGWAAATECAPGDERDRAGARDPGIPLGRVRGLWRGAESLAVPVAQTGDSAAAIESSLTEERPPER